MRGGCGWRERILWRRGDSAPISMGPPPWCRCGDVPKYGKYNKIRRRNWKWVRGGECPSACHNNERVGVRPLKKEIVKRKKTKTWSWDLRSISPSEQRQWGGRWGCPRSVKREFETKKCEGSHKVTSNCAMSRWKKSQRTFSKKNFFWFSIHRRRR